MRSVEQKDRVLDRLNRALYMIEKTIKGVVEDDDEHTFFSSITVNVIQAGDIWDGDDKGE